MGIWPLFLGLVSAALGTEHVLAPTYGPEGPVQVIADLPPAYTEAGELILPLGTTVTVKGPRRCPLLIDLIEPTNLGETRRRAHWSKALTRPGGYMLQYGQENAAALSSVRFVVADQPR